MAEVWSRRMIDTSDGVIGLDVEWKPQFSRGKPEHRASLLQLSGNNLCVIVQLLHLTSVPDSLKKLLRTPDFLKVGVSGWM